MPVDRFYLEKSIADSTRLRYLVDDRSTIKHDDVTFFPSTPLTRSTNENINGNERIKEKQI